MAQYFDTWDGGVIPSTDVAGVAYHAPSGHLFLADSEINELSVFNGDNIFEASLTGDQLFAGIESGNSEPTGITYSEFDGFFYVTNDNTRKITRYDSSLRNSLDSVKTTSAVASAIDPEGITADPSTGLLYVVDGSNGRRQVLVYNSNLNYQYRFSVADRMGDAEGIAFHPDSRTLFIVSEPDLAVFEYTVDGSYVNQYDISGFTPRPMAPQGLTFGPTSDPHDDPNARALYIADGMVDNRADGRIYEAIVVGAGQNAPPQVDAGVNQTITISDPVSLNGTVSDDGLPDPPAAVTTTWSKVSGPGSVNFASPTAVDTTASFSQSGTYVLQLTASDGQLISSDQVTISVDTMPAGPVTAAFQNGLSGYWGTRDTKIARETPTTNFGTATELELDGRPDYASLLAWDISTIPAGSSVLSASITVNVTNPSSDSYEIYALRRNWLEDEATWEQSAAGSNWQVAGVEGATDAGSTALGKLKSSSTGTRTVALNASGVAQVQSWVDQPATNYGIVIRDYVGPTNGLDFTSRETGTAADRPKLTISYEVVGVPSQDNVAPQVDAGTDQTILISESASLNGTVSDDGLPDPPAAVTTTWSKVSGPGSVNFASPTAVDTTASFSQTGAYVLQLTVSDGQLISSDQVTISVDTMPTGPVTAAFQDGLSGYWGTRDTKIARETPTTNFGTATELELDGRPDYASLLAWDISTIPAGSSVLSASITVSVTNPSSDSYEIYALRRNWLEDEATWEQSAAGSNWQVAGVEGSTDVGSTALGKLKSPSTGTRTVAFDASGVALVQSWVDQPAANYGIVIRDYVGPTNGLDFSSRETGTAANRPKLTISYEVVGGPPQDNVAPQVAAGTDQTILISESASLNGTVSDDGLPDPPAAVTTTWSKVSGPGSVNFASSTAVDTTASFSQTGTYVLQLTASDGQLISSDQVTISVDTMPAGPVTAAFQDGLSGYWGTRDTKIARETPTTNFGTATELELDGRPDYASLLAWDISTIPAGSSVLSASITVNVTNPSSDSYEIYALRRNWLEDEATWEQSAAGSNWQVAGVEGSTDAGSTALGKLKSPSTGTRTVAFDASGVALVQSWVDQPAANYGIVIRDYVGPTNGLDFSSREAGTAADRPKLTITYVPAGGSI